MIGYAHKEVFNQFEISCFKDARNLMDRMPSHDTDGNWIRCHELVRAVGPELGLPWMDGSYGMVEHSWLWTRPFEPFTPVPNILDLYCPGRLPQVQLIHSSAHLPYEYRRGEDRTDIRQSVVEFLKQRIRS
jgi:hypothetical protein